MLSLIIFFVLPFSISLIFSNSTHTSQIKKITYISNFSQRNNSRFFPYQLIQELIIQWRKYTREHRTTNNYQYFCILNHVCSTLNLHTIQNLWLKLITQIFYKCRISCLPSSVSATFYEQVSIYLKETKFLRPLISQRLLQNGFTISLLEVETEIFYYVYIISEKIHSYCIQTLSNEKLSCYDKIIGNDYKLVSILYKAGPTEMKVYPTIQPLLVFVLRKISTPKRIHNSH